MSLCIVEYEYIYFDPITWLARLGANLHAFSSRQVHENIWKSNQTPFGSVSRWWTCYWLWWRQPSLVLGLLLSLNTSRAEVTRSIWAQTLYSKEDAVKTAQKTVRQLHFVLDTLHVSLSRHTRCTREHFFSMIYSQHIILVVCSLCWVSVSYSICGAHTDQLCL